MASLTAKNAYGDSEGNTEVNNTLALKKISLILKRNFNLKHEIREKRTELVNL